MIAAGAHRLAPPGRLDLAIGAAAAAAAMALLLFRLRTVFVAVRQAAARSARRPGRLADVLGPALAVTIEPPIYPVYAQLPHGLQPAAERGLGSKVAAGAKWSALNTAIVRVCTFLVGAVLARTVFGPQQWGLYAVSQIVLAVLLSANELGVTGAIIRWDGNVRSFARTVFTLSVMSSTLIYLVLYVTAPAVARLLGSPDATAMLRLLCICVIIDGLAAVPLSLITREFAQGKRMLADIVNFVVTTSVTLWLAFSGHGVISFAWGSLVGNTVSFIILFVTAPYVVLPGWNTKDARQLLQFGLPLAGAGLLTLGVVNVDSAIVGATLGPAMLGLYQLAFNISSWPVSSISQAVERISFAGFSRVANSVKTLSSAFTRSIGLLMAITVPACVLLATLARPLIHTIYGQRWVPRRPRPDLPGHPRPDAGGVRAHERLPGRHPQAEHADGRAGPVADRAGSGHVHRRPAARDHRGQHRPRRRRRPAGRPGLPVGDVQRRASPCTPSSGPACGPSSAGR